MLTQPQTTLHTDSLETRCVLAIDTSTEMLACAVANVTFEGRVAKSIELLGSADHTSPRQANVELVLTVDAMLRDAGLQRSDIDMVLAGTGPGSFTGVRIGVAAAKGFACGLEVPLFGASTLDAVAWNLWQNGIRGRVGIVGDAMRKEVYPGIYMLTDEGAERCFTSETVMKVAQAIEAWTAAENTKNLLLAGDGLKKYKAQFAEAGFEEFVSEELWYPTGAGLLHTLLKPSRFDERFLGDPASVLPLYTRLSDAEENERIRLGLAQKETLFVTGVDELLGSLPYQLRPMNINDAVAVAQLEARVYADEATHTPWSRALFEEEFSQRDRLWWTAYDKGQVIAFTGGMVIDGNLEILDVVVAPEFRRLGIAQALLERVSYDAQMLGATTSTLEVAATNEAAQALYRKMGFEPVGERKNYYGQGNHALVMKADLPLKAAQTVERDAENADASNPWPQVHAERTHEEEQAIAAAGKMILAIESSCDETAMAIIDGSGRIISSVVATQIDFHARFGGVVPEIASRKHIEALVGVYQKTLEDAANTLGVSSLAPQDLSAIACTQGPGLVGALVVGLSFAKALAWTQDIPLVCVNHLEGHLFANLLETPDLTPPFVASLLSGGHTMLVHVKDWGDYRILGETLDDAVGEAFDKVAKALGLGYPGGPIISRFAKQGNPKAIDFPRAMLHSHDYRFSLSGLKTAVVTYIEERNAQGRPVNIADLAASFEAAVIDVQVAKAKTAVKECGVKEFCAGGGVTANKALREAYERAFRPKHVRVTVPPLEACTDNATMIALAAKYHLDHGDVSPLTADADPNLKL